MKFKKIFALITASTIALINISTTAYAKEFEDDLAASTEESIDVSANDIEPEDIEHEDVEPEDITATDIESEDTSTEADENDIETNDTKTTNEVDARPDSAVAHNKKTTASMHKKQHDTTRLKVIELQVKNWHGKEMVDEETGYTYFSDEIGEYIDGSKSSFKSEDENLISEFIATVEGSTIDDELSSSLAFGGTDVLIGWGPILDELSNHTSSSVNIVIDVKNYEITDYSIQYIDDIELEEDIEDETEDKLVSSHDVESRNEDKLVSNLNDEAETEIKTTNEPAKETTNSSNKKDELIAKEDEILPENVVSNADESDSNSDSEPLDSDAISSDIQE